ncbi:hypothetical protein [Sphingomonas sp. 22R3R2A-7]|uniref:hypothetical protein n=1 Tax=Sphingomonas sp. 22R3R2A-7 TaxID=3050230 RepID=UPI002FE36FA1
MNEFSPGALEGGTVAELKTMIDRSHALPVTRQARELGIHGCVYYPRRPTPLPILRSWGGTTRCTRISAFAGRQMLRDVLAAEGIKAGRLRVLTLMEKVAIKAVRWAIAEHKIYYAPASEPPTLPR